jgi:integrase
MSIYKPKGSPFFHFDFQWRGNRFHGSTKRTNRREAEAVEKLEIEQAKKRITQSEAAKTSLQLDDVVGRYWQECGQHHSGADDTFRDLGRIVDYFGPTKLLSEITNDDVSRLVAWRRGHRVVRSNKRKPEECPFISNATVNRTTTQVLKRLFMRAKKAWGVRFDHEPNWNAHFLDEPQERVRELVGDEGERLDSASRADYAPFFAFAEASGLRLRECVTLKWSEVDWSARQIRKAGKGSRLVTVSITSSIRAILWPLQAHHPERVFTYIAKFTRSGQVKGTRYPITFNGAKAEWKRTRTRAGVKDFRFHDYRHNLATKALRATGNLRVVQKMLNHANIETTLRYAHVLDSEVADAMERVTASQKRFRKV